MNSKRKSPRTYRPRPGSRPTTGPRECRECFAPAYSWHVPGCPKTE